MTHDDALNLLGLAASAGDLEVNVAFFKYCALMISSAAAETLPEQITHLAALRTALGSTPMTTSMEHLLDHVHPLNESQHHQTVYVLLYREDHHEQIHTLRLGTHHLVLAFENHFTARKYTQTLAHRQLIEPWTGTLSLGEVNAFCKTQGYGLLLVPQHQQVQPPVAASEDLRSPC